ncbi:MAG: DUF2301 domain-containing membrane protein [Moorea sp. SIO3I7]|uniref:DUF2301 domain-containing membrane protein n=1 Tax=unclassified Moorena TaxID=2683338 RepID=UPI0013C0AF28|nr:MULTISPECIES: DUF2301 domain-containing membrane protein [unclassified Moorena]NEN99405.1 DUF2301 domain-containing membrane protein [Moorena sp. SIO3I7]NEO08062.1 DUF2301 domain-containing membrane protein [Moorena sp. SIO3I8]NEO19846.1 DUF2301 domain-containing membrane protein [Moorena sp. SIO4A5]NEP26195.1 DUF2301 domain-containing membrane protein [Moorena sp. SIO3I6]NEQ57087.1 DUF2301 domain-containing membrane protein [Moorena sp. SIO4A1]
MTTSLQPSEPVVYQGQFGEFTITESDRIGVVIYRAGLVVAALSFAIASNLILLRGASPSILNVLTPLYGLFCLALGVSLVTIHIYLAPLHRLLQIFWGIGCIASIALAFSSNEPLALYIYNHPISLFGIGFTFAALTGIYFKEAFCFNRLETKFLTPLVPMLLLGHIVGFWSTDWEMILLGLWAVLFMVFALRKVLQPIPDDIGDKSVFEYLKKKRV